MDTTGARELRKRIEGHEHWRQAEAVRDGRQPPADPDAHELEEIRDGLRLYRTQPDDMLVGGRPASVRNRRCKRLVDGEWRESVEVEDAGL